MDESFNVIPPFSYYAALKTISISCKSFSLSYICGFPYKMEKTFFFHEKFLFF